MESWRVKPVHRIELLAVTNEATKLVKTGQQSTDFGRSCIAQICEEASLPVENKYYFRTPRIQ